jgi:hypothetical protein
MTFHGGAMTRFKNLLAISSLLGLALIRSTPTGN